ncbi:MAG: sensor histidine kinase, partial [Candidatus Promineifilaceae bacterium]
RTRLLLSYLLIIAILALVFVLAILATTSFARETRSNWAAFEMSVVSRTIVSEARMVLRDISQSGGNAREQLIVRLDQLAENSGVRLIWVVRANGQVVHDTGGEWTGQDIRKWFSAETVTTVNGEISKITDANKVDWVTLLPDRQVNERFAIILAMRPQNPLSGFRDQFGMILRRAMLVTVPVALIMGYFISRSVARPLQRMANAAQGIAEGEFGEQLPIEGPTEVREVARNFNQMAQQVSATQTAQRDFVANVSHDLKTPITSIQGWSQALLDGTAGDPQLVRKSAEIINTEAERMARMVQTLLEVAKLEAGQFKLHLRDVDLSHLLEDVYAKLALKAEKKQLDVQVRQTELPLVSADPDRLIQVFTNLLDNAITHTPAGGTITLKLWQESNMAAVAIEDTGKGIAPNDLSRIFERFYQADKSRVRNSEQRGTGLGLAIVRELVEAHKGTIEASSQLGLGSVFTVRIPL